MKKITLLLLIATCILSLNAQITYTTVLSDDFETATKDFLIGSTTFKTGGIPTSFNVLKQTAWTTFNATNNANVSTGTVWKDVFSSNTTTANKNYSAAAIAENRLGGTGTQCIRLNMTGLAFGSFATPFVVRLRSNDNVVSFITANGESSTKYEVTFWARVDGADKTVVLNGQSPNTYLTLTSTWQKYTLNRYVTGTTATALAIDFYPLADNTDYSIYIDDIEIKKREIAYTVDASAISASAFTANWVAVAGANAYSLTVEKSNGATPAVWTAISGSPFSVGDVTSFNVTNLDAGATYRYRTTATDGSVTTVESNNTTALTSITTALSETAIQSTFIKNSRLHVSLNQSLPIEIINLSGQQIYKCVGTMGENSIPLTLKGVYVLKAGNENKKIAIY